VTAAGYPAQALFGLGAAALLDRDHAAAMRWIAFVGLADMTAGPKTQKAPAVAEALVQAERTGLKAADFAKFPRS